MIAHLADLEEHAMSHFLFIESLDPLEDRGVDAYLSTALDLCQQKQRVTVFFVENGANAARQGAKAPHLTVAEIKPHGDKICH